MGWLWSEPLFLQLTLRSRSWFSNGLVAKLLCILICDCSSDKYGWQWEKSQNKTDHNYVPPPLGEGGTSRFTMVSRHLNVSCSQSASVFARLVYVIFPIGFFTYQILRYGDDGQELELINFLWPWLNFQGVKGSLCFKINTVYLIFSCSFMLMAFKLRHLVSIDDL